MAQRTRELGIRIALGARPGGVVGLVLRQGVRLTIAGLTIGTLLALLLSRFLSGILFKVPPTDAGTYAAVALLLAAIALLASWVPARRATRVDPRISLNAE